MLNVVLLELLVIVIGNSVSAGVFEELLLELDLGVLDLIIEEVFELLLLVFEVAEVALGGGEKVLGGLFLPVEVLVFGRA